MPAPSAARPRRRPRRGARRRGHAWPVPLLLAAALAACGGPPSSVASDGPARPAPAPLAAGALGGPPGAVPASLEAAARRGGPSSQADTARGPLTAAAAAAARPPVLLAGGVAAPSPEAPDSAVPAARSSPGADVPALRPTAVEAAAARLAADDAEAAERAFRRLLLTEGPDDLHALVGLGAALSRQGRSAEAETILIRAVERWPRSAAARNNLAAVRLALGRREAALAELAVARRLAEAEGSPGLVARIDRNIALAGGPLPTSPDRAPAAAAPDATAPTHRLIPRGAGRWRIEPAPAGAPPPHDVPEDAA